VSPTELSNSLLHKSLCFGWFRQFCQHFGWTINTVIEII